LEVMARDAKLMRSDRPFLFTNLKSGAGLGEVVAWIRREVLCEHPVLTLPWRCTHTPGGPDGIATSAYRRPSGGMRGWISFSTTRAVGPCWPRPMPSHHSALDDGLPRQTACT